MNIDVEKLKQIPIHNIARELGIVVPKNKAMCLYGHDRKTPSLTFNVKNNFWHCFGCGAGGDGIKLVQECLGFDFKGACSWLSARFAIEASHYRDIGRTSKVSTRNKPILFQRDEYYKPDPEIYEWLMASGSMSERGLEYLVNERYLSRETLVHFNIKDIENPYGKFLESKHRYGLERLFRCGLAKKTDTGQVKFVWWDHIILFPFYDTNGRLGYIQGRRIGNKEPKYINLIGVKTEIFNLMITRSMSRNDTIYICEGVMDALSAYESGLKAVGIVGAMGFKHEWIDYFKDYHVRVIPDADKAGHEFSQKIMKAFRTIGKSIEIVRLPDGMDFSEFRNESKTKGKLCKKS